VGPLERASFNHWTQSSSDWDHLFLRDLKIEAEAASRNVVFKGGKKHLTMDEVQKQDSSKLPSCVAVGVTHV
jgi:hypothetical protein